jgi:tetratricopeptide (TPR) repeat protein
MDPSLSRGFFFLGEAYFFARRFALSEQALKRSRDEDSDNFLNLYLLGRLAKLRGDMAEARQLLELAVGAFEKFPEALCVLGQLAVRDGDVSRARDYLKRAARLDMGLLKDRLQRACNLVGLPTGLGTDPVIVVSDTLPTESPMTPSP